MDSIKENESIFLKDGSECELRVCVTVEDEECMTSAELFKGSRRILKLSMNSEIYVTAAYGRNVVGVLDSVSADLGEIAHQLYANNRVRRRKFPYGILLYCDTISTDTDRASAIALLALNPNILESIVRAMLTEYQKLLPASAGMYEVVFAYYGETWTENSEDVKLIPVFQGAGFGTFRCEHGLTSDGDNYIATYLASAVHSEEKRKWLQSIPWEESR